MKTPLVLSAVIWMFATSAAEFVNLTFDEPDLSRLRKSTATGLVRGSVEDLLRGWEVSIRLPFSEWSVFREEIEFREADCGVMPITLNGGLARGRAAFSVRFNSLPAIGFTNESVTPDVRLSTRGIVPLNARFLEWDEGWELEATVTDGQRRITAAGNVGLLDVSQFVGKEVTIQFELRSGGYGKLDVVGFTQTAREIALSPPSKMAMTSTGKDSVTLSWAPSTDSVIGYEVFSAPNRLTPFTNRVSNGLVTETVFTYSGADAKGRFYQVRSVGSSSRTGTEIIKYSVGATCFVP